MAKRKTRQRLISQPKVDPYARLAKGWIFHVGAVVKAGEGLPIPEGTEVTVKMLVPGVHEPGYIVSTSNNGDYWVRQSEVYGEP